MGMLVFGFVLLLVGVMRVGSNNLVIMVPTEGGMPMLNLGDLRQNLRRQ